MIPLLMLKVVFLSKPIHTEPVSGEHEGNKAVHLGNYKLVSKWSKKTETNWELYKLEEDRTEMNNLSITFPEIVKEMSEMYDNWATTNKVLPWNEIEKRYSEKKDKN